MSAQRTIAIVGAGFSGTLVAINLLKASHRVATRIVLIERSAAMARGKAYADREHAYLLNVPAGRMSADPTSPSDFLAYAQQQLPQATADDLLPRHLYGQYLESALLQAEVSASSLAHLDRVQGEVCSIEQEADQTRYRIQLAQGNAFTADDVVLALGNPQPADLPGMDELLRDRHASLRYVRDPWDAPLSFQPGEKILVIGTGLTMIDVVTAAAAVSNNQVVIHAISRHGLLPAPQTSFPHTALQGDEHDDHCNDLLRAACLSARTLFRAVRKLAVDMQRRGGDWREAITFVRNIAPSIWEHLAPQERKRMLRHAQSYWDIHRHRAPSETLTELTRITEQHQLHVHAGRLLSFEPQESHHVRVTWRPRGSRFAQTFHVDRIINCTGPSYDVRRSHEPLMRSLLSQGLATPDALHLGLRTDTQGALIDSRGRTVPNLFYVGPLLRANYWEATAAHELRGHAERLARHLTADAKVSRSDRKFRPHRNDSAELSTSRQNRQSSPESTWDTVARI